MKYFKLSKELGNGDQCTVTGDKRAVIDAVSYWLDEFRDCVGESCRIEIVEIEQLDFDNLEEI